MEGLASAFTGYPNAKATVDEEALRRIEELAAREASSSAIVHKHTGINAGAGQSTYVEEPSDIAEEIAIAELTEARRNSAGRKDDSGKDRLELIPPEAVFALARVLAFGAAKYEDRNWEKGMKWGRVFGAALRHLWAWWGGRGPTTKSFLLGDLDSETKFSHLWHALCCVTFLVAYEERGIGVDDRARPLVMGGPANPSAR